MQSLKSTLLVGAFTLTAGAAWAGHEHHRLGIQDWFKHLDANGDGVLTAEEVAAAKHPERAEHRFQRVLAKFDANKDGKLSLSELPAKEPHVENVAPSDRPENQEL